MTGEQDPNRTSRSAARRQLLLQAVIALAIIIATNLVAHFFASRVDVTSLRQFTLTPQTKDLLGRIDAPVTVTSFFTPGPTAVIGNYVAEMVREYRFLNERIEFAEIDPEIRPDLAQAKGIDRVGALVGVVSFEGPAGRKLVYGPDIMAGAEHELTSALMEVTGERQKRIYFLKGHGERTPNAGLSAAAQALRQNLFQVEELDLTTSGSVPTDAAAVIVAGPGNVVPEVEIAALSAYLQAGGALMMMLDRGAEGRVETMLAQLGIAVPAGKIVDDGSFVAPVRENLLIGRDRNEFGLDDIYFPSATAVFPLGEAASGADIRVLAWTTPRGEFVADGATAAARQGAIALGTLVTLPADGGSSGDGSSGGAGRLIVTGDSDFATDAHFGNGNNGTFLVQSVLWLTAEQRVVNIERKVMANRRLLLDRESELILNIGSLVVPGLAILAVGMFFVWRRRWRTA